MPYLFVGNKTPYRGSNKTGPENYIFQHLQVSIEFQDG